MTGGASAFQPNAKQRAIVRQGLKTALSHKGVWVITGGMKAGVMELVGEIVAEQAAIDSPVPAIGIGECL